MKEQAGVSGVNRGALTARMAFSICLTAAVSGVSGASPKTMVEIGFTKNDRDISERVLVATTGVGMPTAPVWPPADERMLCVGQLKFTGRQNPWKN